MNTEVRFMCERIAQSLPGNVTWDAQLPIRFYDESGAVLLRFVLKKGVCRVRGRFSYLNDVETLRVLLSQPGATQAVVSRSDTEELVGV